MRMKYFITIFINFSLLSFTGIAQNRPDQFNISLRTGDLIFCSSNSGELSKAIDQVTQTGNKTHFDHVGIVEILSDTVWVFHAAPKKGVCREVLRQFFGNDKNAIVLTVYRLKINYLKTIPGAIQKARTYIGKSYNYSYLLKENGLYCSEFIYKLFTTDSIFTLNPMTFKDPATGKFLPGWINHYQKLGIPVPEGEPGCNPNGLAASEKLKLIGELKIKTEN